MPLEDFPKLLAAFRQYGSWLERLGIDSVGALNDAIRAGRSREIILVSEALHEQHIASIARQIAEKREQIHLVLISGPSSSGKTTFARRLAVQLLALGLSPFALEMDNYFVDREKTPRDENGEYDFEAIEALNLPLLGEHLERLLRGEEVQMPRYNFKTGQSEPAETVRLRSGQSYHPGRDSRPEPASDSRFAGRAKFQNLRFGRSPNSTWTGTTASPPPIRA